MPQEPDVYRDWLGITETARPLNYYQLLGLSAFEDDASKIREGYRSMNALVRKAAADPHAARAQELLSELAKAMLCLTDVKRKREYDAGLGRRETGAGRRRTLEEILLANQVIDQGQLEEARRYADQVGLDIRDAVLQKKLAAPDVVMLAYAESQGLPYVELDDVGVDQQLVAQIPAAVARQHSCLPIMAEGGRVLMASPSPLVPDVEDELRLRLGVPVRTVLCTPISVNRAIAHCYARGAGSPPPLSAAARTPAKMPVPRAAQPATAEPKAKPPAGRDEQVRQRVLFAVVAFNIGVILGMLLLKPIFGWGFGSRALISILVGLVAAAGTYFVMTKMDL